MAAQVCTHSRGATSDGGNGGESLPLAIIRAMVCPLMVVAIMPGVSSGDRVLSQLLMEMDGLQVWE